MINHVKTRSCQQTSMATVPKNKKIVQFNISIAEVWRQRFYRPIFFQRQSDHLNFFLPISNKRSATELELTQLYH